MLGSPYIKRHQWVKNTYNTMPVARTSHQNNCLRLPPTAISSVIMLTQVPKGMKRSDYLMQMEATLKQYTSEIHLTEEDIYDADRKQPPRYVPKMSSGGTCLNK